MIQYAREIAATKDLEGLKNLLVRYITSPDPALSSELGEVYAEDYGAIGDGNTDCTNALQTAMGEGNTRVKLGYGVYMHTGLTLPNHVILEGCGAKNTILRCSSQTANGITLGTGKVQTILGLKIDAVPKSSGSAIYSSSDIYVSDFFLDRYEIEGFNKGVYIPYGLEIYIGFGRLIGIGKATVGSVGITLGDHALAAGITVNTATIQQAYVSSYETNNMLKGTIHKVDGAISESCKIAYDYHCRLVVSGSWVQADTYLFQNTTAGWPATSLCNLLYDGSSAEVDDVTTMVNLADVNDLQVISNSGDFKGVGQFMLRYALTKARGLRIGSTNNPTLYNKSGILTIEPDTGGSRALDLDRTSSAATHSLLGLNRSGVCKASVGLNAEDHIVFLNAAGSQESLVVDSENKNIRVGQAIATDATNGFLYIPSCAGTPTGVPTAITGLCPLVVNSTNNKLYFYSGGAWRDAGP